MTRKQSDPDRVRALARKHPEWSVSQLAERTGMTYQRVQSALRASSSKRGRPRAVTVGQAVADTEARREELHRVPAGPLASSRLRGLRLLYVLLERGDRGATVAELQEEIGCSRATLYRLRDEAIAAGFTVTIAAEHGFAGAWTLVAPEGARSAQPARAARPGR